MKAIAHKPNLENNSPRIVALILLAGCLLLLLAGCKPQSASDLAGSYTLVSIDGKPVPCLVHHEGMDMNVKSGSFTLTADDHCRTHMVIGLNGAERDAVIDRQATCRQSGAEFTMKWEGFGQTRGVMAGNVFTMNNEGMVFEYRK